MNKELGEQFNRAREYASEKASIAREKSAVAYDASREAAEAAREHGTRMIQQNPLAMVAGGLAVGALVGALWPRTAKHGRASSAFAASLLAARGISAAASGELARAGGRIKERISEIDTGPAKAKLSEIAHFEQAREQMDRAMEQVDRARERMGDLLEKASERVSSAGKQAANTLRRKD